MSDQELNDKQNQIPNNLEMSFEESKSDQTLLTDEMPTFKFNNLMDSPVSSIGFNSSSDDSSDEEREKTVCLKSVSNEVPSNCSVVSGASDSEHYISLEEINAQISSPWEKPIKHKNSLETIFEGKFLETPPKQAKLSKDNKTLAQKMLDLNKELDDDDEDEPKKETGDVKENINVQIN